MAENIPTQNSDIDIKAIAKRLWEKRKFILIMTGIISAWGLVVAICQKSEYKTTCTFVPQFSSPYQALPLYSFSAVPSQEALGAIVSGETFSPLLVPKLLDNVEFNKELMRVPLRFNKFSKKVTLFDYYTDPQYKQFDFIGKVKKYTIDIPGRILNKLEPKEPDLAFSADSDNDISRYSKDEYDVAQNIKSLLEMKLDKKEFCYTLSVKAPDPLACADLCQATLDLAGKYITSFKILHAQQNLEFMKNLHAEAEKEYKAKQLALAKYVDSNRGALTATTQIRKEQLTADYNLALAAFSETSKQLLLAEVKVREDTPSIAAVNPVSVPNKKSNSRVSTLLTWVFLGCILSCATVFGLDYLKGQGCRWPKKW